MLDAMVVISNTPFCLLSLHLKNSFLLFLLSSFPIFHSSTEFSLEVRKK